MSERPRRVASARRPSLSRDALLDAGYQLKQLLGQGGFAKVWCGTHEASGSQVAIKSFSRSKLKDAEVQRMVGNEIRVMNVLPPHPNVIRLLEHHDNHRGKHLVMELCERGSLFAHVRKQKVMGDDEARFFFRQLENLLFFTGSQLKLADFGLAVSRAKSSPLRTQCGSFLYMAPELHSRKSYHGFAVDIWALGVVLFVMLAGYFPFNGASEAEVKRKIKTVDAVMLPHFSAAAVKLLSALLAKDPAGRPTAAQVLEFPWVTQPLPDGFEQPEVGRALSRRRTRVKAAASARRSARGSSPSTCSSASDSETTAGGVGSRTPTARRKRAGGGVVPRRVASAGTRKPGASCRAGIRAVGARRPPVGAGAGAGAGVGVPVSAAGGGDPSPPGAGDGGVATRRALNQAGASAKLPPTRSPVVSDRRLAAPLRRTPSAGRPPRVASPPWRGAGGASAGSSGKGVSVVRRPGGTPAALLPSPVELPRSAAHSAPGAASPASPSRPTTAPLGFTDSMGVQGPTVLVDLSDLSALSDSRASQPGRRTPSSASTGRRTPTSAAGRRRTPTAASSPTRRPPTSPCGGTSGKAKGTGKGVGVAHNRARHTVGLPPAASPAAATSSSTTDNRPVLSTRRSLQQVVATYGASRPQGFASRR